MKNLNSVAKDLFNKLRGRFPSITIGDSEGNITNAPEQSRFYDFTFVVSETEMGKVSIGLDEENGITVVVSKDMTSDQPDALKRQWYQFLRELRQFAKKRMLTFDVRDINKSNLQKRDYKYLAANRPGEDNMNESRFYGTSKTSFLDIGSARLRLTHSTPVNAEMPSGRTQHVESIYIESPSGERFKYPFKHISGAKAMARHVSEGGNLYDEFGTHIVGLSEELSKLKTFNRYMNRSSVMAESLAGYTDIVKERIQTVKKTVERLQKEAYYKEAFESFEVPVFEDVPTDVSENWVDQLTIKQFNEELKDVFPYIYKLVGEATRAKDLGPDDLLGEGEDPCWKDYKQVGMKKKGGKQVPNCVPESEELEEKLDFNFSGDDLKQLQSINNVDQVKKRALDLITTNSSRPMKPEKIRYFKNVIASKKSTLDVIKMMYDMMLSGEGAGVIGTASSTRPNSYRSRFGEEGEISEKDVYRSTNKYKLVDPDYNNFKIYVSIDKAVQGQFIATAVSIASDREPENVKSLGNKPDIAVNLVKQKLDARTKNAQKVTGNATLDFNVAFTRDFFDNDADDLGIEGLNMFYAKIIPGPALVVANMVEFGDTPELLTSDGFSRGGNRSTGGTAMIAVGLTANKVKAAELVANGRYLLGKPSRDSDTHYVYPMKFDSVVLDKNDTLRFKSPAVTVGSSRMTNDSMDFESQIEEHLDSLMGQFSEDTVEHGDLYVKFRSKQTPGAGGNSESYLIGFAGFVRDPKELTYANALRKFTALGSKQDIANAIKKLMNDKVFVSAKKIVLYHEPAMVNKYDQLGEFFDWMETYKGDKIKVEYALPGEKSDNRGTGKKRLPKGHFAANPKDYDIPDKKMTRYFTIGNSGLMNFLRTQRTALMQKYFRPATRGFVMNDAEYNAFLKMVNSPNLKDQFGDPKIMVDKSKSFAEDEAEMPPTDSPMSPLSSAPEKPKTPIGEFIMSYFDKETGKFPKGETAVLTAIQKDYGDQYVRPAQGFIEQLLARTLEIKQREASYSRYPETEMIKNLAGI